jgi:hypothetical protein
MFRVGVLMLELHGTSEGVGKRIFGLYCGWKLTSGQAGWHCKVVAHSAQSAHSIHPGYWSGRYSTLKEASPSNESMKMSPESSRFNPNGISKL